MRIKFQSQYYTPEELSRDDFKLKIRHKSEKNALEFIKHWFQGDNRFRFYTSGSTGQPKETYLTRDIMEYSARTTLNFLGVEKGGWFLLCIDPGFVGGAMVIVRAILNGSDLEIIPSSSKPNYDQESYRMTSVVPLQIPSLLTEPKKILDFEHVLIGGTSLSSRLEDELSSVHASCHQTFGMTETASHIALRKIGTPDYTKVGDIEIQVTEGQLEVKGSVTNHEWLHTNDVVVLTSSESFQWLGRIDHVINSGGIKINPESLEKQIEHLFDQPIMFTYLDDESLGQKLILLVEGEPMNIKSDFSLLKKYHQPKDIFWLDSFVRTENQKIQRNQTREKFLTQLQ